MNRIDFFFVLQARQVETIGVCRERDPQEVEVFFYCHAVSYEACRTDSVHSERARCCVMHSQRSFTRLTQ